MANDLTPAASEAGTTRQEVRSRGSLPSGGPHEVGRRGDYLVSTDPALLDLPLIHDFLSNRSYWAAGIPVEVVRRSTENSLCFGLYQGTHQIGFARVVTDGATFAYLADVFVIEAHRGQGLSKWLLDCVMRHPHLQGLRRFLLGTRDAHSLYERHGFTPLTDPERFLEIFRPDVYSKDEGGRTNPN
jgi:GNAT superfamily N-acetyltransferase